MRSRFHTNDRSGHSLVYSLILCFACCSFNNAACHRREHLLPWKITTSLSVVLLLMYSRRRASDEYWHQRCSHDTKVPVQVRASYVIFSGVCGNYWYEPPIDLINAATCGLVISTSEHITDALSTLYWLRAPKRIQCWRFEPCAWMFWHCITSTPRLIHHANVRLVTDYRRRVLHESSYNK